MSTNDVDSSWSSMSSTESGAPPFTAQKLSLHKERKLKEQLVNVQEAAIKKIGDMSSQMKFLDEKNRRLELEESVMLGQLQTLQKKLQRELKSREEQAEEKDKLLSKLAAEYEELKNSHTHLEKTVTTLRAEKLEQERNLAKKNLALQEKIRKMQSGAVVGAREFEIKRKLQNENREWKIKIRDYGKLENENKKLKKEMKKLKAKCSALSNESKMMKESLKKNEEGLKKVKGGNGKKLLKEIESLREENSRLRTRGGGNSSERIRQLQKEVLSLKDKIRIMEISGADLPAKGESQGEYQQELNKRLVKKNMDLQGELEALQKAFVRSQQELDSEDCELLARMENLKSSSESDTPLLKSLNDIQGRATEYQRAWGNHESSTEKNMITIFKDTISVLEGEREDLLEENEKLERGLRALEEENIALSEENRQLVMKNEDKYPIKKGSREHRKLTKLKQEVKSLKHRLAESERDNMQTRNKLENIRRVGGRRPVPTKKKEEESELSSEEIDRSRSESEMINNEVKRLKEEFDILADEKDELNIRLEASMELIAELEGNMGKPAVELVQEKTRLEAEMKDLKRELSINQKEVKRRESSNEEMNKEGNEMRRELKTTMEENEKLKFDLNNANVELETIRGKIRVLEEVKSRNDVYRDESDMNKLQLKEEVCGLRRELGKMKDDLKRECEIGDKMKEEIRAKKESLRKMREENDAIQSEVLKQDTEVSKLKAAEQTMTEKLARNADQLEEKNLEIEKLENRLAMIRDEMLDEQESSQDRNSQLEKKKKNLMEKLRKLEDENSRYENEVRFFDQERSRMEERSAEMERKIKNLKRSVDESMEEIRNLEMKNKQLNLNWMDSEENKKEVEERLSQMRSVMADRNKQIESIQNEMSLLSKEKWSFEKKSADLEDELKNVRHRNETLELELKLKSKEREDRIRTLQERVTMQENEYTQKDRSYTRICEDNNELKLRAATLEGYLDDLKHEVRRKQSTIDQYVNENRELVRRSEDLNAQMGAAHEESLASSREVESLKNENELLLGEIEKLRREKDKIERERMSLNKDVNEAERRNQEIEGRRQMVEKRYVNEIAAKEAQIRRNETRIMKLEIKVNGMEEEKKKRRETMKFLKSEHNNEVRMYEQKIETLKDRLNNLECEIDRNSGLGKGSDANGRMNSVEIEFRMSDLRNENQKLKKQLDRVRVGGGSVMVDGEKNELLARIANLESMVELLEEEKFAMKTKRMNVNQIQESSSESFSDVKAKPWLAKDQMKNLQENLSNMMKARQKRGMLENNLFDVVQRSVNSTKAVLSSALSDTTSSMDVASTKSPSTSTSTSSVKIPSLSRTLSMERRNPKKKLKNKKKKLKRSTLSYQKKKPFHVF